MKRISLAIILILTIGSTANSTAEEKDYSQYILTPAAPDTPRINGPKVYGARRNADFLFKIPASGKRPMSFASTKLPSGLKLDSRTGIISGKARKEGEYSVEITATNSLGSATRTLRIVIGDKIALTPPMGWNSWNCWGNSVSQEKVMSSAKAMLEKGLDRYGWSHINIDDGWQGLRGGKNLAIQPNKKFPDMKALADFLHANGLKLGIYSSPWLGTYAGHIGSSCDNKEGKYWWIEEGAVDDVWKLDRSKYNRDTVRNYGTCSFAKADAAQWAEWGVDYLKYDWKYNDAYWLKDMHDALKSTGRDIVYSISNSAPIALAPQLMEYAQCWRTTGDIRDNWDNFSRIGFGGQDRWGAYKRPGNWPDADMLVVGKVGWGPKTHWVEMTPDEQYTHISLWAILASPLLIGCDMAEMDDFTVNLLCNNEVIDINQDPLGYQASKVYGNEEYATYVKPLEDGSLAVAMFNLSDKPRMIGFIPNKLGLYENQTIRDVWRQKDIATVSYMDRWETEVAPHGVCFVKLSPGITFKKLQGRWIIK